ncbi:MAG: methylamine methyltransferase corrinoid protein reductive activase [Eubacteriales bacterium]
MTGCGIALDLGTSGFRGQLLDLKTGRILGTVITARHPVPGANVMDHLNFAVNYGLDAAHSLVVAAVNQVIGELCVPKEKIKRVAVCGNPIQLSLFEGIEIRDLAFAGERKRRALGVQAPNRDAKVLAAGQIGGLDLAQDVEVLIPPAVKHEIGADALAMMLLSGFLDNPEICLVTDYGTNAEMALKVGDEIITCSCAAGPALEGQHIRHGMLAAPGAISDVSPEGDAYRNLILDSDLTPRKGGLVEPARGTVLEAGLLKARGITGTGVISVICEGLRSMLIQLPKIKVKGGLHLADGISFSDGDIGEAGKAIGALRAGYVTLAAEAGIEVKVIKCAYMAGASGTYVDAYKGYKIGMVPPAVDRIYQVGNTSLALACRIVLGSLSLSGLQELAGRLRARHCMLGDSKVFTNAYLLELSYWGEGLPWSSYRRLARSFKLPALTEPEGQPEIIRIVQRDINDLGAAGLKVIERVSPVSQARFNGCLGCGWCVEECPEKAVSMEQNGNEFIFRLQLDRCNGTACLRCERGCPERVFSLAAITGRSCQKAYNIKTT